MESNNKVPIQYESGILPVRLFELFLVNLLAWWGVRVLSIYFPYEDFFSNWEVNSPERWGVRLVRAILTVTIVLGWGHWRKIPRRDLGLGGPGFWRNMALGIAGVAVLWIGVVAIRGTPPLSPEPIGYGLRGLAILVAAVDVTAQQLPTFGLLQRLGGQRLSPLAAFLAGWLTFGVAHVLLGSLLTGMVIGLASGLIFAMLLRRTKNLGAGLGMHFGFYLMLAVLGWGTF